MKISYSKAATKDVQKIKDKVLILKIEAVIEELKRAENLNDVRSVKKLSGHETAYRIRIGDYRLGILYEDNGITIARIVKRNDIYKLFP